MAVIKKVILNLSRDFEQKQLEGEGLGGWEASFPNETPPPALSCCLNPGNLMELVIL